jgi:hypothetical protein
VKGGGLLVNLLKVTLFNTTGSITRFVSYDWNLQRTQNTVLLAAMVAVTGPVSP